MAVNGNVIALDLSNLSLGQLGFGTLAVSVTALSLGIQHVLLMRPRPHVRWIDAGPVIAGMKKIQPVRNRADKLLIGIAMCRASFRVLAEVSVSVALQGSSP